MASRERLMDEAKLYCPRAAAAIHNEEWQAAAEILLAGCKHLDMALQSLTPGGSEYVGDPERCVRAVREARENLLKALRIGLSRPKTPA